MRRWIGILGLIMIVLGSGAHAAAAGARGEQPVVKAARTRATIKLDGRLNEPAWRHAGVIANLAQQSPSPGKPTPFHTRVLVLRDARHLYFGIKAVDPEPGRIAVHTLKRDGDQTNDDHITIVLDTFNDQRIAYVFQVNAGGARTDGLISPASPNPSFDFDALWNAATRRTKIGWTAEIAIDTRSLQFGSSPRLGLNIERYVPRRLLTLTWSGHTLNASVFNLQREGTLVISGKIKQGLGIEFSPYALTRYQNPKTNAKSITAGFNLKYNLTPQLAGILTGNPDFSQAEVDTAQVNLTRFPLFFPEKRDFFLQGSNRFSFATGLSPENRNLSTGFIPYFSRRIGLVNGEIVPINEGAKLIGQAGPLSIGALDAETRTTDAASATNLFAGRAAYNLSQNLQVGALLTHGDPNGDSNNSFVGIDTIYHTSQFLADKNLTLSAWGAKSSGDVGPGRTTGWGARIFYPNDLWYVDADFNEFGDALDPALGFLPRPGTRQYHLEVDYQPRPSPDGWFGWIRQQFFNSSYDQVNDLNGSPESRLLILDPVNFQTESGNLVTLELSRDFEALDAPFNVADDVVIPLGDYYYNRAYLAFTSSPARAVSAQLAVAAGDYYTGRLTSVQDSLDWTTLSGHLQLSFQNEIDYGYLPQGNFIERLWQLRAAYSFSPNVLVSTYAQYDDSSKALGINTRFEWIIAPGKKLFVVWNHGHQGGPSAVVNPGFQRNSDEVTVKLQWNFSY